MSRFETLLPLTYCCSRRRWVSQVAAISHDLGTSFFTSTVSGFRLLRAWPASVVSVSGGAFCSGSETPGPRPPLPPVSPLPPAPLPGPGGAANAPPLASSTAIPKPKPTLVKRMRLLPGVHRGERSEPKFSSTRKTSFSHPNPEILVERLRGKMPRTPGGHAASSGTRETLRWINGGGPAVSCSGAGGTRPRSRFSGHVGTRSRTATRGRARWAPRRFRRCAGRSPR